MRNTKLLLPVLGLSLIMTSCSEETHYNVTGITINSIPETQGSVPWDDTGGSEPDVFPSISTADGDEVWRLPDYQFTHVEDATNADFPFIVGVSNLELDAETRYSIKIWDYEYIGTNELMATMNFTPEALDLKDGANEVVLTSGQASVTVTFDVYED